MWLLHIINIILQNYSWERKTGVSVSLVPHWNNEELIYAGGVKLVFSFKTQDYVRAESNGVDYILLPQKLISILYIYTSSSGMSAAWLLLCWCTKRVSVVVSNLAFVVPFVCMYGISRALCLLCLHCTCSDWGQETHPDGSSGGGQMGLKEPLDFFPKVCFADHRTRGSSLCGSGWPLRPLRHSQLVSQGLGLTGFSLHLTCDVVSSTEETSLCFRV